MSLAQKRDYIIGRRDFIAMAGGAAVTWPRSPAAQQPEGVRRVGVLIGLDLPSSVNDLLMGKLLPPYQDAIREAGWIEGKNIHTAFRFAASDSPASYESTAVEVMRLAPDLVFAVGLRSAQAVQRKTQSIPIVFTRVADPVGLGLVASLGHPGGNITGIVTGELSMAGKWMQFLLRCVPQLNHVGVIYNPASGPYGAAMAAIGKAAGGPGVTVIEYRVHNEGDLAAALSSVGQQPRGGLIIVPDPFTDALGAPIIAQAARLKLPILFPAEEMVERGALISYDFVPDDMMRLPVTYIDRILKGESPANLPVQAPARYTLVINLKTANALGLTIPASLLATADRVIE